MTEPVSPAAPKLVTKATSYSTDVAGVEHRISSWHVNGWLLVLAIVVANVVGIAFHV